jgi:hypothetical protein
MGAQRTLTLPALLNEAANTDVGIFSEAVDRVGLVFQTHETRYNRTPLELDAEARAVSLGLRPVLDDQRRRNDVTVSRPGGSSVRVTDGSPLVYDESVTIDVEADTQLEDHANWRLHLGTFDGMRYPTVTVDLTVAPTLIPAVCKLIPGDWLRIVNLPSQHPADAVDLIIEGWSETITPFKWTIDFTCSPATPWTVGVLDDDILGRLDSETSTLDAGIDDNDTSLSVDVVDAVLWTDADGDFDIVIGGEVMTVTAIAGASSPQTFTVTRSVNGVAKSHLAGASVRLANPLVLAL